jgi:hypothetical protein
VLKHMPGLTRDRWFESPLLQRRVSYIQPTRAANDSKGHKNRSHGKAGRPLPIQSIRRPTSAATHIDQPLKQDLTPFDLCRRTAREDCLITSREKLQFSK